VPVTTTEALEREGERTAAAQQGSTSRAGTLVERVLTAAYRPVDIASLAALRVMFGALLFVGTTRFVLQGWIEKLYGQPTFFFKYWGFSWVKVWPLWGMYLHYGALIVLALFIALGLYTRVAITLFLLLFAYVQLMDVTNYLNHYYLVVLLLALLALLPTHAAFSLDVKRRPSLARESIPAWMLGLLRFELGVV
jgi:vitamin K-dependent gamma-carboxylase